MQLKGKSQVINGKVSSYYLDVSLCAFFVFKQHNIPIPNRNAIKRVPVAANTMFTGSSRKVLEPTSSSLASKIVEPIDGVVVIVVSLDEVVADTVAVINVGVNVTIAVCDVVLDLRNCVEIVVGNVS